MRGVLTALGLAAALFASAAQAAICPEVIEMSLAASSKADTQALRCLMQRTNLVLKQNIEHLNAVRPEREEMAYILYFTPNKDSVRISRVEEGLVDYDIKLFHDASHLRYVIRYNSPFYGLAVLAHYDLLQARKEGKPTPETLTELVEQVSALPTVILAFRWPAPYVSKSADVKAEGN